MVKIEYAFLKGNYRILWLRYVYGVDLSNHCMKCLLGHNDKRVRGFMHYLGQMELEESKYYYLCGVDENFEWAKNLHLAFAPSFGSTIELDNNFIKCKIVNAIQLPIDRKYVDFSVPHSNDPYYNTCRNWWFAHYLNGRGKVAHAPQQQSLFDDGNDFL